MNIEEMVNHYRAVAQQTADECAAQTNDASDCARKNYMLGAYSSIVRELLSEMDEATRQRLARQIAAWQHFVDARERAA